MSIELMDIFYLGMICVIFGFIIHLEAQVSTIKTMLESFLDRRNGKAIKDIRKK
jgi:hypothetical protein